MKLCITEKPSVARDIASILGATERHDGYYEGNGFRVTWTLGHLCCLYEPDDYTPRWKRWCLSELPMLPSKFDIKVIKDQGRTSVWSDRIARRSSRHDHKLR